MASIGFDKQSDSDIYIKIRTVCNVWCLQDGYRLEEMLSMKAFAVYKHTFQFLLRNIAPTPLTVWYLDFNFVLDFLNWGKCSSNSVSDTSNVIPFS